MKVKIYKPSKNAMQSGLGNTKRWLLEFVSNDPKFIEPIMGWVGSRDTRRQVSMAFDTAEEAVNYAVKKGYEYQVFEPKVRKLQPKAYADNFSFKRIRNV